MSMYHPKFVSSYQVEKPLIESEVQNIIKDHYLASGCFIELKLLYEINFKGCKKLVRPFNVILVKLKDYVKLLLTDKCKKIS